VQRKFLELGLDIDDSLRDASIKISGCPNSCGQHEVATIGFFGGATRMNNAMTPTYTMLFGGSAGEDGELGKAVIRVPAKRVIDTTLKIIELFKKERANQETLHQWIIRLTKGQGSGTVKNLEDVKAALGDVIQLPSPQENPDAYKDYGSDSYFTAKTARGECAA
jgi:sulfite reductase (ferredoxin)